MYKHIIYFLYSLREKKYFNLIKEKTVNPQVYYKYKFKTNATMTTKMSVYNAKLWIF